MLWKIVNWHNVGGGLLINPIDVVVSWNLNLQGALTSNKHQRQGGLNWRLYEIGNLAFSRARGPLPMMMKLMMGAFHLIEEKLPCLLDKFRFAFAENHLQGCGKNVVNSIWFYKKRWGNRLEGWNGDIDCLFFISSSKSMKFVSVYKLIKYGW